jgi:CubicO group peptidase (beta-lactamase class C family)
MLVTMNRRQTLGCGLLLPITSGARSMPDSQLDTVALARLHQGLDAAIAARRLPGATLWVERLGRRPHQAVFGLRAWEPEPEPLAMDAVFDVASLTKPVVTGLLAAQLLEQGRLRLDDPVRLHLERFGEGRDHAQAVQVRHLLTHSSGLPAILPLDPPWQGDEAALALALAATPTDPPGRVFRYSDVNYILLGRLIESVAGQALDRLAAARIFEPLGMHDSGFKPRHAASRLVPTTFEAGRMLRGVVHDPAARRMGGVAGHAGLFSTAADLARLARAMLGGGRLDGQRVLSEAAIAAMTRNAAPAGLPARGLGWDIDSPYSRPRGTVYPAGRSFGHTGFTGCALWLDPASESFYVFLSNRVHPRGSDSIVSLYEEVGTWAARAAGAVQ